MYRQIFLSLLFFLINIPSSLARTNFKEKKIQTKTIASLNWQLKNDYSETDKLFWEIVDDNSLDTLKKYRKELFNSIFPRKLIKV